MVTFKQFFSFKHNRWFWLNLMLMVATLIAAPIVALQWLDIYTRHGEAVVVPQVEGTVLTDAQKVLAQKSLKVEVVDSSFVKGLAPGTILDQNPKGNARVKEGRTIYLTINAANAPQIAMPDVMDNSSLRQAEAKLRSIGFKLTEHEYVSGEKDWVYAVKYRGRELKPGEKVPHEALLTLSVGNGGEVDGDSILLQQKPDSLINTDPIIDESWF